MGDEPKLDFEFGPHEDDRNEDFCDRCKHGRMVFLRMVDGKCKYKCDNCDAVVIKDEY